MKRLVRVVFLLSSLLCELCFAVEDTRNLRQFKPQEFKNVGLEVYIPRSPVWEHRFEKRGKMDAIILTTPANYYPVTNMQMLLRPDLRVRSTELEQAAIASANEIRRKLNLPAVEHIEELHYVEYGQLKGYADVFDKEDGGQSFSFKSVFGVMPSEQPVSLIVSTPKGQLEHVEHMALKIWKNLKVLPSSLPPNVSNERAH